MKTFSRAVVLGVPLLLCLQPAVAADRRQQQSDAQASDQSARSQGLIGAHAAAGIGTRPNAPQAPGRGHGGGGGGGGHDSRGDFDHYDHGDNRYRDFADRGRVHSSVGIYLGGPMYADPFWGPPRWGYYSPWYYDPPPRTVIIEREPTVYIQQPPPAPAPQPQAPAAPQLWYYCPSPAGYYPYVPQCQQQWVPVDPASLPPAAPRQ